jgi:hypothetical protein
MLLDMKDLVLLVCAVIAAFVVYVTVSGSTGDWTAITIVFAGLIYAGERIAHNRKKPEE